MLVNQNCDKIDKKKSDHSTAKPCQYYINELSEVSPEITYKYILDKYNSLGGLKKRINAFVDSTMFFVNREAKIFLDKPKPYESDYSVESVYKGMAGIALLFNFYASKRKNNNNNREMAKNIIEKCLLILNQNSDCITYLTGKSGIYVTAAEIYKDMGDLDNVKKMIKKVVDLLPTALNEKMPDVLFYGRAGYLYSLLVLKKIGWEESKRDNLIRKVVVSILNNGIKTCASDKPRKTTLLYKYHGRSYLGTAKGLCGVLFCLLLSVNYITKEELEKIVRPALDYLLTLRFESGNLPSSLCDNEPDVSVKWCHGASGASLTYVLAYRVLHDKKYLRAAEKFAEVVWKRGLLTSGYGLCHGVCGNAYCFISLFKITANLKYLYQAAKFVDWSLLMKYVGEMPKYSCSLFRGMPGVAYTLLDIQDPSNANFPGFEDMLRG